MESTAFVSATPILVRSSLATSSFAARPSPVFVTSTPKRARVVMSKDDEEKKSIPQGFTSFSENLNGRAAMMGFVLAIVTEAITGQGIVGQVEFIAKVFEVVSPFN